MSGLSNLPRKKDKDVDDCVFKAFGCLVHSCSPSCGYRGVSECLCIRKSACFECGCNNTQPRLLGVEAGEHPDEYCKVGLYCCDYALIKPRVCMASVAHLACMKTSCSLPCHEDYIEEPMCALYCISCYPDCGIAVPPPKVVMLERMSDPNYTGYVENSEPIMDRGDALPVAKAVYDPVMTKDTEMI